MPDSIILIEELTQPKLRLREEHTLEDLKASLGAEEETKPIEVSFHDETIEDKLLGGRGRRI